MFHEIRGRNKNRSNIVKTTEMWRRKRTEKERLNLKNYLLIDLGKRRIFKIIINPQLSIHVTSELCSARFGIVLKAIIPKSLDYENAILIQGHTLSSAPRKKGREELFAHCVVCHFSVIKFKYASLKNS